MRFRRAHEIGIGGTGEAKPEQRRNSDLSSTYPPCSLTTDCAHTSTFSCPFFLVLHPGVLLRRGVGELIPSCTRSATSRAKLVMAGNG